MSVLLRAFTISLFLALVPPVVSAQSVGAPETDSVTVLTVGGDLTKSVDLSMADILKLKPHGYSFKTRSENERPEFDGVTLETLLALVGVKSDDNLWGNLMDAYLLVESADGKCVVFSLPEIYSGFAGGTILAFRRDGQMLDDSEGPLRLINGDYKRKARWVKHVRKLTIVRAKTAD